MGSTSRDARHCIVSNQWRQRGGNRRRVGALSDHVRYPRHYRDSVEQLRGLPVVPDRGQQITLSDLARLQVVQGPLMPRSKGARLSGWAYVDIRGRDPRSAVHDMQTAVAKASD